MRSIFSSSARRAAEQQPEHVGTAQQAQTYAPPYLVPVCQFGLHGDRRELRNKVTATYPVTLDIPFVNLSATLTSQACLSNVK